MRSRASILVIRGAPGLGKSTLVEMFRSDPSGPDVIIDVDDIRQFICGDAFRYKEDAHYHNAVSLAAHLAMLALDRGSKQILVVDVFAGAALAKFLDSLDAARKAGVYSVSLVIDDQMLVDRMDRRHEGFRDILVAQRVNQHIFSTRAATDRCIDIGGCSEEATYKILTRSFSREETN